MHCSISGMKLEGKAVTLSLTSNGWKLQLKGKWEVCEKEIFFSVHDTKLIGFNSCTKSFFYGTSVHEIQ